MKKALAVFIAASLLLTYGITANADEITTGDVNGDGRITASDSLLVQRYTINLAKLNDNQLAAADMNSDGKVTNIDALLILKQSIGLENPSNFGVPENITLNCGDRIYLTPQPQGNYSYRADGTISKDGSKSTVLEVYTSGMIKAYHPGVSTVTITNSNGKTAKCVITVENNTTEQTISIGDHTLKVTKKMMTLNDAYNETDEFNKIQGLVVHSTAEPGKNAAYWYNEWNKPYTSAAVHAFLDDEGVYQYLPFEQTAWHAGPPCNYTHIDFEICEPAGFYYDENWNITDYNVSEQQEYFNKIWDNATTYAAYLCHTYGLTSDDIISHYEAGQLGIGTQHDDPDHWFVFHNKTMDDFRNDVAELLKLPVYVSDEKIVQ